MMKKLTALLACTALIARPALAQTQVNPDPTISTPGLWTGTGGCTANFGATTYAATPPTGFGNI